jgi:hypothetical protein
MATQHRSNDTPHNYYLQHENMAAVPDLPECANEHYRSSCESSI